MEQHTHGRFDDSPLALSAAEIGHLKRLRHPARHDAAMPCSMLLRFLANDCIRMSKDSLALTPRGRTAALIGRL